MYIVQEMEYFNEPNENSKNFWNFPTFGKGFVFSPYANYRYMPNNEAIKQA